MRAWRSLSGIGSCSSNSGSNSNSNSKQESETWLRGSRRCSSSSSNLAILHCSSPPHPGVLVRDHVLPQTQIKTLIEIISFTWAQILTTNPRARGMGVRLCCCCSHGM